MQRHTKTTLTTLGSIGILSLAALATGISIHHTANAATQDLDFSVALEPSLYMNVSSDNISLNLIPNDGNTSFDTADLNLTVGTNNPTGYTLSVSTDEGTTVLTRTDQNADGTYATISTLPTKDGGYSETDFTTNRWGYKVNSDTNYLAFPDTSENALDIFSTSAPSNASTTTMTFAAKADLSQPTGTYKITLNYIAVTNPYTPSLSGLTSMQAAASYTAGDVCDNTETGVSTVLKDLRDGKFYKVQKLQDGKCWMMENLALDGDVPLTITNTNYASAADLAKVGTYNASYYDSTTQTVTLPANVSGGDADYLTTGYTTAKIVAQSGSDAAGNYNNLYNYCAASAGTFCMSRTASSGNKNATSDICPAGWRLPTGGTDMETGGEFTKLLAAYNGDKGNIGLYDASTDPTGEAMYEILVNTLKFPLAGGFSDTTPTGHESDGSYWTSTFNATAAAMDTLRFGTTNVNPQGGRNRFSGRSVRCVLK